MSERHSSFHGWRARTHYLTRNRHFLLRTSAAIIAVGMAIACLVVVTHTTQEPSVLVYAQDAAAETRVQNDYVDLHLAKTAQPRQLALLLRRILNLISMNEEEDHAARSHTQFRTSGTLEGYDVAALLKQHTTVDAPTGLFEDFLATALTDDVAALSRLQARAQAEPPLMLAAELYGVAQKQRGDRAGAAYSFYQEGLHFPDAEHSRDEAVRLAVVLRDFSLLRSIAAQAGWIEGRPLNLQLHAGSMLNDIWLQWRILMLLHLRDIPYGALALTLFAAWLWYFILVSHSDHGRWRWLCPIPAVVAGVLSIWPTLTLVAWQDFTGGMTAEAPFPQDLIYYVLGVGLREEACKLALFAFFLPWLLWRRQPGLALLTGAFVGLGFALEENVSYYQEGGGVAWARFVTANFLHIAMTGICAHSLYEMLRTRFARADQFIASFAGIVAAHGVYDWLLDQGENAWLATVVLVVTASRFIDLLGEETRPFRLTISPRAVFTLGSAVLIAVAFITGAWTTHSMQGVADAGLECIGMVPIAVLYWRKFEHA